MSNDSGLPRHLVGAEPRVLVVDGSRVVRRLIEQVLRNEVPSVTVESCETGADACRVLDAGVVDFVTTALRLPDMDGLELARRIRENATQAFIPIVVVSGDVQERLVARSLSDDITDYFDKSLGFGALAEFIRGYVHPNAEASGTVLYVEDSRVVALATGRMLERNGLTILHVASVEEAVELLENARSEGRVPGVDVVLSDVSLKGDLTGGDLLERIRGRFGYGKGLLPVLIMTGDDNPKNQATLLRAGANDLVRKPVEERLLVTKLLFQLRVAQHLRRQTRQGADAPDESA
ncbi:MAG TPA: response regulator [Rhodanobacteraceae bacterium]|nr:response regulator [Rhodanobacteraceae bacterium]